MALFKPNLTCLIRKRQDTNVYGEERLGDPVRTTCSIISLNTLTGKSSVRADSSGSRGAAVEMQATGKLLFLPQAMVSIDDQIEVVGWKLRVVSVMPWHNLKGVLDHYEVLVTVWGKP